MSTGVYQLSDYQAPNLPDLLKGLPGWLLWRFQKRPGEIKLAKVPYYSNGKIRSGVQGSDEDRQQMTSYRLAHAACLSGGFSGIGLAILPEFQVVALDFDNCVTDGKIEVPWIAELATVTYSEYSPSGRGVRAFMKGSLPSKKDTQPKDGKFAVEVFGDGGYVTVTGNTTSECQLFGLENTVADVTEDVLTLFRERFGQYVANVANNSDSNDGGEDDTWLLSVNPTLGWTPEQAREYLFACDASCSRDVWLKILMGLHFESGGAGWALELACEWSATGDSFAGRKDVEGRWRSFRRGGGVSLVTGSYIMNQRAEQLTKAKYASVDSWRGQIEGARSEMELREVIAKAIRRDASLGHTQLHNLASVIQGKLKSLTGVRYPIKDCRNLISPMRGQYDDTGQGVPEWLNGWVYVTDGDQYYKVESGEKVTVGGFNTLFNRYMPKNEFDSVIINAHTAATCKYEVKVVSRAMYMPACGPFFKMDGIECVNSYHHSKVPKAAEVISQEGAKAVEKILWHIEHLIADGRSEVSRELLSFMSFCVKFPGKKVRWAPIIKGIEGDGKSLIGTVMGAMLGESNIRIIGPSVIKSDFNNWAEGACLGVLEEMRMVGHNRFDIANKVKPHITNESVEIHLKGKSTFNVPNTMNYIAFTNFGNAIPLTEEDRRWYVIFTACKSKADLREFLATKGGYKKYFSDLTSAIRDHYADFKKYLLDYEFAEDFDPNGMAKDTVEKSAMVNMGMSDEELIIRELIEKGCKGVRKNAILTSCLTDAWIACQTDVEVPRTRSLAAILIRMGYTRYEKRVRFEDRIQTLWTLDQKDDVAVRWKKLVICNNEGDTNCNTADEFDALLQPGSSLTG